MTSFKIALVLALGASSVAFAEAKSFTGSGVLNTVVQDLIKELRLQSDLTYVAATSGDGEKALLEKKQYIAPMSRKASPAAEKAASAMGVKLVHVPVAIDGVAIYVNAKNALPSLTIDSIKKIFACEITTWDKVEGSGRTGAIKVYKREDTSGTTDSFKNTTGLAALGACATYLNFPAIDQVTEKDEDAITYGGLNGKLDGNRTVAIGTAGAAVQPSYNTLQNGTYPMIRTLYVVQAQGSEAIATQAEKDFLDAIVDADAYDAIVKPIIENQLFVPVKK